MSDSLDIDNKLILKQKELDDLKKELDEYKELSSEIENLKDSEINEKEIEIKKLNKIIEENSKKIENFEKKAQDLRQEIKVLTINFENFKLKNKKENEENQLIKNKIIELEQQNEELTNKLRLIEFEFEDTQEKYIKVQEDFIILKEDRDELEQTKQQEILLLKEEIKAISEEHQTHLLNNSKAYPRQESIIDYVDLRQKYTEEIDQLKDELSNLKQDYNAVSLARIKPIDNQDNNELLEPHSVSKLKDKKNSRISSFFSKGALEKMVLEIQNSGSLRKKTFSSNCSEKEVDPNKKMSLILQENVQLKDALTKVRNETNKNRDYLINEIKELENTHKNEIENITKEFENQISQLKKNNNFYTSTKKNSKSPQKIISKPYLKITTPSKYKKQNANSDEKKTDFQIFLFINQIKQSKKLNSPYLELKSKKILLAARITKNGLDKNINNLTNGKEFYFDNIYINSKLMEKEICDLNVSKKIIIIYGPKKSNKKQIQKEMLENIVEECKKYLQKSDFNDEKSFNLNIKTDSFTDDTIRKIKPYSINFEYKNKNNEFNFKKFDQFYSELKKSIFARNLEKSINSTLIRFIEIKIFKENEDLLFHYLIISSNKFKSKPKNLETRNSIIEDITKLNGVPLIENELIINFDKYVIFTINPTIENHLETMNLLEITYFLNKKNHNSIPLNGKEDSNEKIENNSKEKNLSISIDNKILKEKISRKNKELTELKQYIKNIESENMNLIKKTSLIEKNNLLMKHNFQKIIVNLKKISNDSTHKKSRKLMRVPTNIKIDRQTNIIQKLMSNTEYINFTNTLIDFKKNTQIDIHKLCKTEPTHNLIETSKYISDFLSETKNSNSFDRKENLLNEKENYNTNEEINPNEISKNDSIKQNNKDDSDINENTEKDDSDINKNTDNEDKGNDQEEFDDEEVM